MSQSKTALSIRAAPKLKDHSPIKETHEEDTPLGRDSRVDKKLPPNTPTNKPPLVNAQKKPQQPTARPERSPKAGSRSGGRSSARRGVPVGMATVAVINVNTKPDQVAAGSVQELTQPNAGLNRSSKKQRQQIKALTGLQRQVKVHLMRKTILSRVKKLAMVRARLLGLYKGWKVRRFMKQPSVKALVKEIQVARARDSKSTKQNYSKE